MKCKKCKSDDIKRFEVMYEQGTSNVNLASDTLGVGITGSRRGGIGFAKTQTSGKSQTLIAEKTKPPKQSYALSGTILFLILVIPLFAKDGNGCVGSTSVTLNRTQITATYTQVNVLCNGVAEGSITVRINRIYYTCTYVEFIILYISK